MAIHRHSGWRLAGKQLHAQGILPEATCRCTLANIFSSAQIFPQSSAVAPRKRPQLELLSGSRLAGVSCSVQSLVNGSCAKPQGSVAQATTQLGFRGKGLWGARSDGVHQGTRGAELFQASLPALTKTGRNRKSCGECPTRLVKSIAA